MSHSDSNFYKPFIFVLGALVIFTLFIGVVANMVSPKSPEDPLVVAMTKKSIEPVGRSRVVEVAESEKDASAEADSAKTAAKTDSTAVAEESTTTAAATETDEAAAAEASEDTASEDTASENTAAEPKTEVVAATNAAAASTTVAANGAVSMKVKATVATNCAGCHNAGLDGAAKPDDADAWSALSANGLDALTASVINGKGKMPARAESSLSDAEIKQAVQLMISNATGSDAAGSASGATTTAAAATVAATPAATETVKVADASAATTEIPAAVKQVVDTACAACHLTGVASSPKYGDKDAWAPRIEKGIDGLTASAIAGIGIMPPRGGSSLDDEQMKLAVEYMLSK